MVLQIDNYLPPELSNLLITFVVPFLIIFTVLLFALKKTKIFGGGGFPYIVFSLGITIMIYYVNPGNVFQFLASYLVKIGIAGTIIALAGVMIMIFWRMIDWGTGALKSSEQKFKDLRKKEEKLLKEVHGGGVFGLSTGTKMEKLKQLKDIEDQIKRLEIYLRAKGRM